VQMKFDEKQGIKTIIAPQAKHSPGEKNKGKYHHMVKGNEQEQTDYPGSRRKP